MKKMIGFASVAALAACSPAETEAPAVEETAAVDAVAGSVAPGDYNVTWEDGATSTFTLNEDGTYIAVREGETVEGTSEVVEGKVCFTASAEGAETQCWTNSEVGEDGGFTSASDDGMNVTLSVAAAAAE
jgi:hypothetical protein